MGYFIIVKRHKNFAKYNFIEGDVE